MIREEIDEDSSDLQVLSTSGPKYCQACRRSLSRKKKQKWAGEETKLDNARKLKGINCIDPEDNDFNETLRKSKNKLERKMDSALSCRLRKTSKNSSMKAQGPRFGKWKRARAQRNPLQSPQKEKLCMHTNEKLTGPRESALQRLKT